MEIQYGRTLEREKGLGKREREELGSERRRSICTFLISSRVLALFSREPRWPNTILAQLFVEYFVLKLLDLC